LTHPLRATWKKKEKERLGKGSAPGVPKKKRELKGEKGYVGRGGRKRIPPGKGGRHLRLATQTSQRGKNQKNKGTGGLAHRRHTSPSGKQLKPEELLTRSEGKRRGEI